MLGEAAPSHQQGEWVTRSCPTYSLINVSVLRGVIISWHTGCHLLTAGDMTKPPWFKTAESLAEVCPACCQMKAGLRLSPHQPSTIVSTGNYICACMSVMWGEHATSTRRSGNQTHNPACCDNRASHCYGKSANKRMSHGMTFRFSSGHADRVKPLVGNSSCKHFEISQLDWTDGLKKTHCPWDSFHMSIWERAHREPWKNHQCVTVKLDRWDLFIFLINCRWTTTTTKNTGSRFFLRFQLEF